MTTMMQTDAAFIESIQSRSPALSFSDYECLKIAMESGELLPEVVDPEKRAGITQSLLATEELIPSLYTLIKDIRYLQQPAKLLAKFLPESRKKTLRQRWFHHFTGPRNSNDSIIIQQGVLQYTPFLRPHLDYFDVCYQQLWLCAYRVYKYPNAYGSSLIADLADKLGFSTPKIDSELMKDPAQAMIKKSLEDVFHILRPNEKFDLDFSKASPVITSFKEYVFSLQTAPEHTTLPFITVDGIGTPILYRCGHGQMDTRDLANLFLDKIHAPLHQYGRNGDGISSFYVKRSRHIAFFGRMDLLENQEGSSTHPEVSSSTSNYQQPDTSLDLTTSPSHQAPSANREPRPYQALVSNERVVRFDENGVVLQEVPFRKEEVNSQAKEYADQGRKLSVKDNGGYFLWEDCFDILIRTRQSVVTVSTVVESWAGKRRWGVPIPEKLQPARKEAYDQNMDEDVGIL